MAGTTAGHIDAFLEMLAAERGRAANTLKAYAADLADYAAYATSRGGDAAGGDPAIAAGYIESLAARGLAARTQARRLSALRQFHRFLLRDGHAAGDPTSRIDAPKPRQALPKCLSETEVESLLAAARAQAGMAGLVATAALELLYATGLRVSELLALPARALAQEGDTLMVRGKGGKDRLVVLSGAARTAARALLAARPAGTRARPASRHLFAGRAMRGGADQALTRQAFWGLLKAVARDAGIDPARVSPHVLRHSFASHMLARGADLRSLQTLLGHADIATTQIYTHLQTEHLRAAVETHHPLGGRGAKGGG